MCDLVGGPRKNRALATISPLANNAKPRRVLLATGKVSHIAGVSALAGSDVGSAGTWIAAGRSGPSMLGPPGTMGRCENDSFG